MKSRILCSLLFTSCLFALKKQEAPACCGMSPHPMRVTMRHIEANGIGYNQGYSTLEGFFAPAELYRESWIPFLDLRSHVFNDGKWAANAGLGLRHLGSSRIWGINGYYDYRNTHRQHYNQVSLGLESLGRFWDFRLNGYLPVGKTTSKLYRTKFSHFHGNNVYISRKQEFAMKGANAEVGYHVDNYKNFPLYFAAGPYYLEGKGKTAWGGQLRATMEIYDYFRIEGNTSYDNVFKWIGQGQVSIIIPFGKRRSIQSCQSNCPTALALSTRALQRVDRFEIIPVDTKKKHSLAIDPATGQPWIFWFVNNTSHSAGTFESPFNTLLDAQNASFANQVIYAYPGDGTTTGMDQGITLQDSQQFLGASIDHPLSTTLGTITIPSIASSLPSITNTAGSGNVVTVANNNTVSGFNIISAVDLTSSGIFGTGNSNLTTNGNSFITLPGLTTNGIYLINPTGQVTVNSSTFNGFTNHAATNNGNGILIELDGGTLNGLTVANSLFTNIKDGSPGNGGNSIFINTASSGTLNHLLVTECSFTNHNNTSGISNYATISTLDIINNNFSNYNNTQAVSNYNTTVTLNFINNTCSNFTASDAVFNGPFPLPTATITTLNMTGNKFVNFDTFGYGIANFDGGLITTINSSQNIFDTFNNASNGFINVYSGAGGASTITTLNSTGDVFVNFSSNSIGLITYNITTITNLNITGDRFNNFSGSSIGLSNDNTSPITNLSISDTSFTNLSNDSTGIFYFLPYGNATAKINNNTFSGTGIVSSGFAATIEVDGSTLCLDFTGNTATPVTTPAPYALTQTGGVFNRTTGSDNTTNTGVFTISGTVNAPGSCSE